MRLYKLRFLQFLPRPPALPRPLPAQVAALIECQLCVGIEKAKIPSDKAVNMDQLFRMWMGWYGKKYSPYRLYQVLGKSSVSCTLYIVKCSLYNVSVPCILYIV